MKPTLICVALASVFWPLTVTADTCSAVKSGKTGKAYNCSRIVVAPQGNLAGIHPPQIAPVQIGDPLDDHHNVVLMPAVVPQPDPQVSVQAQPAVPDAPPLRMTYFRTRSGGGNQELTPRDVNNFRKKGLILSDGSLTQQAMARGFSVGIAAASPTGVANWPIPQATLPEAILRNTYFLTRNGVTTRLTEKQVLQLFGSRYLDLDGSLTPQSIAHGFSVIDQRAPNLVPTPMNVPDAKAPGQVPTQQQAAVPNLVPTPMNVPDAKAPGQVPPQQQAAVPNLLPTPMNVPDAKAPGQVPTQQQAAIPNLAPTPMNVPNAKAPGQVPPQQQAAVPNLVEQKTPALKFTRGDTSGAPPDFFAHNTYFLTRNGVTTQLTSRQVNVLFTSGNLNKDGVLTQQSIDHGFSMIDHRAPNLAPTPMNVPGAKAPDQVPPQQQAAVPNLAPMPMNAPAVKAPDQVPPQQQAAVPDLVAQVLAQAPQPSGSSASPQELTYFRRIGDGASQELTPRQVNDFRRKGLIRADGSLTQQALKRGFSFGSPAAVQTGVNRLRPDFAIPEAILRNAYFLTRNGVTTRLNEHQVIALFNSHYLGKDGVLSRQSIADGFSMIDQRAPNLAPIPMNVPNARAPGQVPPQQQAAVPNLVQGATVLVPHRSDIPKPVTSGRVATDGVYSLEFIEPGLQSRKVKVYRSNDVAEQVYKDTIPLDQGGFQVIVVGTRNPDYIH